MQERFHAVPSCFVSSADTHLIQPLTPAYGADWALSEAASESLSAKTYTNRLFSRPNG